LWVLGISGAMPTADLIDEIEGRLLRRASRDICWVLKSVFDIDGGVLNQIAGVRNGSWRKSGDMIDKLCRS